MVKENKFVKKTLFQRKDYLGKRQKKFPPGIIEDVRVKDGNRVFIKEENRKAFKLGISSLPVPGLLQFNPKEEQELQFTGCLSIRTEGDVTVGNYASLSSNLIVNGKNGNDNNLEIDMNNLFDKESTNVGQLFNNSNVSTNIKSEKLNNIISNNNSFVNYPYQEFDSNNIHDLSNKEILFIPYNESIYEVKIRDKIQDFNKNNIWDIYISNNFKDVINNKIYFVESEDNTSNILNNNFKFYNINYTNGNFIEINNNGSIIFNNTEIFSASNVFNHTSLKKISFIFTDFQFDNISKKQYCVEDDCLFINYTNLYKEINNIKYYISIQIKLILGTNTESTEFNDENLDIKPGSIIVTYGKISQQITDFIIGLSNEESSDEINYDKFLKTSFIEENGFGVPKLNASIGIYYNNGDMSNQGITQQKVVNIFTGKVTDIKEGRNLGDYSISNYSKNMTFRLKVKDDNWGGFYSDTFKGVEYYVKILDLGEYLPSKLFIAIQSIFDFSKYSDLIGKKGEFYSSISGTDSNFNGEINFDDTFNSDGSIKPWEEYVYADSTTLSIPTLNDKNKWVELTGTTFQEGIFNSKIHKIFIKKYTIGSFENDTSHYNLYSDSTNNTNTKYLLKIIYTLKSDTPIVPSSNLSVSNSEIGHGPYHFNPLYRKMLNYNNITSYVEGNIYKLTLEANTTYNLSIVDYKNNPNRKFYGFNLDIYQDLNFVKTTKLNENIFPTIEFTTETNVNKYTLLVRNDRKVPFYGIKLEKKDTDIVKLLTLLKPNRDFIITNIIENTPRLLLSYDDKTETDQYGEYLKNEIIYKIILKEDNTSKLGYYGYDFIINHNPFNTIFLGDSETVGNFLDVLKTYIRYYNLDYSYKQVKNYNYNNLNQNSMDFQDINDLKTNEVFLVEKIKNQIQTISNMANNSTSLTSNGINIGCHGGSGVGFTVDYDLTQTTKLIPTENNLKDSIITNVSNASSGTYEDISTTSDNGNTSAKLKITINNTGVLETVTVTTEGTGYSIGEKITVVAGKLGNNSSKLEFTLKENNLKKIINLSTITINQRGRGYSVGDTLTIKGTDTTIEVASLSTGINHMDLTYIDDTKVNIIFNEDKPELSDTNIERINVPTVGGSGNGCTVDFDIDSNDKITNLRINQGGTGYNRYEKLFVSGTDTSFFIDCQGDKLPFPYEIYKNNMKKINSTTFEDEIVRKDSIQEFKFKPNNTNYEAINSFTIFESRYFMDFPLNPNEAEFPTLNSVSTLFDCIVLGLNIDNINTSTTDKKIKKIKIQVSNNNLTFYSKIVGTTTNSDGTFLKKEVNNNFIYGLSQIGNLKTGENELRSSITTGATQCGTSEVTNIEPTSENGTASSKGSGLKLKVTPSSESKLNSTEGTITITDIGTGYKPGNILTIPASSIGSSTPDLKITLQKNDFHSIIEIDNLTVDIEQTQSNYLIRLYIGFDNKNTLKGLEPVDNTKPTKTRAKLDFNVTVTIDTNETSVNQLFLKHKILYP